jgi:prephenate dehydratase
VHHCLITHPGTALQEIRYVYSHEQALAQCRKYLQKLDWIDAENIIPAYDTAGAVKMIKARARREEAAIAAPQAAALYGMRMLVEDIQTDSRNHTRFLVLSHRAVPILDGPCKTTLILTLPECARLLPALLADQQIELLKLETRKRVGHPWAYTLYLECAGRADRDPLRRALAELRARATEFRLIGSYPRLSLPDR